MEISSGKSAGKKGTGWSSTGKLGSPGCLGTSSRRRCGHFPLLDTRLILETEKACSAPTSLSPWMAGRPWAWLPPQTGQGLLWRSSVYPSVHLPGCSEHQRPAPHPLTPRPGVPRTRTGPGADKAFSPPGKPYSREWTAAWSYLYSLATSITNSGSFTFTPKPAPQDYQRWKVGALRIVNSKHHAGEK